jgi:hypothetical protein
MSRKLRLTVKSLAAASIITLGVLSVHAQEGRGLIIGQVTDPHGAVVPNATVTAVREGTQQHYTAQTNSGGNFSIPYLLPGVYAITVEATGFKKALQTGITVDVAGKVNLNIALDVGSVSETVTVQGETALVNTADASGGTVIDPDRVQNLPLNGRQIYTLLDLTPGVKFTQTTFGPGGFSGTRGWDETNQYSINGVSGLYNQFTLNGAPITQQTSTNTGQWEVAPNVDAVHEFKVMTNTYDAQYGRAGGGTINTIIKNGTKDFHGTAFDFWRNDILDANTFQLNAQGLPRQRHNQHQFGGTFGGPIPKVGKDTFFFVSFEGWREILPNGIVRTTPAVDVRPRADGSVDFRQYFSSQLPLCSATVTTACYNPNGASPRGGIYDPFSCATRNANGTCATRNRFSFNGQLDVIPPSRISPIGLKILNLYPLPNNAGAGEFNNFTSTSPGRYRYNQPLIRIDHKFSDKTHFYGMYLWWSGTEFRSTNGFPGPAMRGDINYRSNKTVVLDTTHTFSSTLFGDLRVSYNRTYKTTANGLVAAEQEKLTDQDLGLTMPVRQGIITTVTRNWAPTISVAGGYEQIIGNAVNQSVEALMYETYEISPSISKTAGNHSLHFGAQAMRLHAIPGFILGTPNGSFAFNPDFTRANANNQTSGANNDGAGLAALLLGYPTGGSVDFSYDVYEYYHYFGTYIQDDFKLRRNLTLNLGLRWDVELSPHERYNKLNAGFDYTVKNPITDMIAFPTLPNGAKLVNPIVGGFKFSSDKLAPYDTQWKHFQPRVGVAFSINPKTVLRGGWGMFTAVARELGGNTTWTQNTGFTSGNPADAGNTPSGYFNTGIPYPNGVFLPLGNSAGLLSGVGNPQSFDQRNRKIPTIQQYSFGFQRELPGRIVLDVSYVGSNTKDLRVGTQINHLPTSVMNQCQNELSQNNLNPANPILTSCSFLEQTVPNPFYFGNLNLTGLPATFIQSYKAGGVGAQQTVRVKMLMTAFPQFWTSLFSNTEPVGSSNYNSLIVKLDKRLSGGGALLKGLSILTSFTYSRDMGATGFLNNSAPNSGSVGGGRLDEKPVYAINGNDRKFLFAFSGIWGLPIGTGGLFFKNAKGAVGQIINDWKLDWIFKHASGTPISIPNGFYFNCPNHPSYLPDSGHQNYGQWLYNESPGCFTSIQGTPTATARAGNPYAPITQVPRVSSVRAPWAPQLALAMSKDFNIREGWRLQFKAEAFNVTNTPIFGGPSTANPNTAVTPRPDRAPSGKPGSCDGYGCIGQNQLNFPRQMQLSLKLIF